MPTSCSAFGCTNRSSNCSTVSFHQVPSESRNKSLRKQWLNNIKREGELPSTKGFYICSKHFEPHCFKRDLQVYIYSLSCVILRYKTLFSAKNNISNYFVCTTS